MKFFGKVDPQLEVCSTALQRGIFLRLLRMLWARVATAMEKLAFGIPVGKEQQKKEKEKEKEKDRGSAQGSSQEEDESLIMMARATRLHQILDRLSEYFHAGGQGITTKAVELNKERYVVQCSRRASRFS